MAQELEGLRALGLIKEEKAQEEPQQIQKQPEPEESTQQVEDSEEQGQELTDLSTEEENPTDNESKDEEGEESSDEDEDDFDWGGWSDEGDEELADLQENERVFLNDVHQQLGIQATSMTQLRDKFKDILSENTKLKADAEKQGSKVFANDQLRRANEVAQNGGNYLEYLGVSQTNWDLFTDEELFRARIAPHFTDANGNINVDDLDEYMESLDDVTIKMQGSTERQQRKSEQEGRLRQLEHEAIEHKRKVDMRFRDELNKVEELFGLKVTAADKKMAHKNITEGDYIRDMFYDKNGDINYRRIIENEFMRRKIKDIVKVHAQRALSKGKKEILDEATNTNIKPKSNSEIPKFTKEKEHSVERFMDAVSKGDIKIR